MERRLMMNQSEMARASGLSQQYISRILNGDRNPSLETAMQLEQGTGVCREAWLWPDRHFNPYIDFSDPNTCLGCKNRGARVKWVVERCMEYLNTAESKVPALQLCLDAMVHHNGYDHRVAMSVRTIEEDGYRLVVHTSAPEGKGPRLHPFIPKEVAPYTTEHFDRGEVTHWPNINTVPDCPDKELLLKSGYTSALGVPHGNYFFAMSTINGCTARWTDDTIELAKEWAKCISENLSGSPGSSSD